MCIHEPDYSEQSQEIDYSAPTWQEVVHYNVQVSGVWHVKTRENVKTKKSTPVP